MTVWLRNMTATPIQLDHRVLFPGSKLEFPRSILNYKTVQDMIRNGRIRQEAN